MLHECNTNMTETQADIRESMFLPFKLAAEKLAAFPPVSRVARRINRRGTLILAYHNVVPDDWEPAGDTSLHVRLSDFRRQVDHLQEWAQVVPLASIPEYREDNGPAVAITFDDAYAGAVLLGIPEVSRRGLPSTVFVAPGILGGQTFWWDQQAAHLNQDDFVRFRQRALWELEGDSVAIQRENPVPQEPGLLGEYLRSATIEDLHEVSRNGDVTIGSHSWRHPNLAALGEQERHEELERSMDYLKWMFPAYSNWLAYPYGLADPATCRTAEAIGYSGGLLVDGGWCTSAPDTFNTPRLNIPRGMSHEGFALRVAGMWKK